MTELTSRTDGTGVRSFRNPVLPGCHPDPSVCRAGFLRVWAARYASSNGWPSSAVADVDRVEYAGWDPAASHLS